MVEVVAGLHDVLRALVGDAGAVGAEALERDEDLLGGGYVLGRGGGEGEVVVGSEKGAEVRDVEEGFDVVEGCGVCGDVVDEGLAGGGGGAVEGGGGGGCGEK